MEEQTLVDRLEEDDPTAVRELYRQYQPRVRSVVQSNVDRPAEVEDVTQTVLWKVYDKIDSFRRNSALWTWMYRIAVNEARMRTRKRRPTPVESETLDAMIDDLDRSTSVRPDERVALNDILETVQAYLDEAKETNRAIFLDLEFGRATRAELGERFGLSESAVKARLHRMRVGLRERIRDEYLDDGD